MSTQNDVCPICLYEKSEDDEELRKLHPCSHFIHYNCMSKSVNRGIRLCPLCRGEVYGLIDSPSCFRPRNRMPVHTVRELVDVMSRISTDLDSVNEWVRSLTFGHITQFNIFCLMCHASNPSFLYFDLYLKSLRDVFEGNPGLGRLNRSFPVHRGQSLEERLNGLIEIIHYFDQFDLANHPDPAHIFGHRMYALEILSNISEEYRQYQTHPLTIMFIDFLSHPATLILSIFFVVFFILVFVVVNSIICIKYIFI